MNFSFVSDISALASFLEGVLSFFSPCVLPLLPVYFSFLSGGNAERNENGEIIYKRSKVVINTLFFVLGISLTFFILSLGVKGVGKIFSTSSHLFSIIGGALVIIFGLWQLLLYGTKYGAKKEKRFSINTNRAKGPLLSFLLGFSFSFSWTPCIGPILSSVLIMASSSLKGEVYLLLYALGFTLPFILLAFFTSSLLSFFQKYKRVVKYTVRIGAVVMILLGIMMIVTNIPKESEDDKVATIQGGEVTIEREEVTTVENQIEREEENKIENDTSENTVTVPVTPTMTIKVVQKLEDTEDSIEEKEIEYSESETTPVESNEESVDKDTVNESNDASIIEEIEETEETENGKDKIEESKETEEVKEEIEEKCDLDLLDFTFLDQYGKIHRLSSYKGKVIFLNAWATWCGPCRSELPEIDELYKKYKDSENVVVLTVAFPLQSGEGNTNSIKSFMKSNEYSYPVLFDTKGKLLSALGISAFPTTFLFDKKGNIYGYIPGAMNKERMEKAIEETLNSL
ncbi:MAG: redoxin family protein [Spirochaetales bacterium]|nr:redoxin family protein [Spirochaetales bacterium]